MFGWEEDASGAGRLGVGERVERGEEKEKETCEHVLHCWEWGADGAIEWFDENLPLRINGIEVSFGLLCRSVFGR